MNNCADLRVRVPLYLSGEMEAKEREAFETHLAGCSVCAAQVADDRNLDATLRSALGGFAPDTRRLEHVLHREISMDRRRRVRATAGAIAATVTLLAGAALAWSHWTRPPQWYADAARDHRSEVIEGQPRHWRFDDAEVAELAAQNGLQLVRATAMAADGYRLERAKICGVGGRRMLHLVFSRGTQRYSIFVSPHQSGAEKVQTVRQGAEQIAAFETGRFRAVAVSSGSAAECTEFARAAERRL